MHAKNIHLIRRYLIKKSFNPKGRKLCTQIWKKSLRTAQTQSNQYDVQYNPNGHR